jgi:hypothetical protein
MTARVAQFQPTQGVCSVVATADTTTTGVKLSYVCPANRVAVIKWLALVLRGGTLPTIAANVTVGGVTVQSQLISTNAPSFLVYIPLNATDKIELNCTVAQVGSNADLAIGVEEWNT